jgi:hypothetical protein
MPAGNIPTLLCKDAGSQESCLGVASNSKPLDSWNLLVFGKCAKPYGITSLLLEALFASL